MTLSRRTYAASGVARVSPVAAGGASVGEASRPFLCGSLPAAVRVYAVGDVHGCLDLLDQMHEAICADAAATGAPDERWIIYVGDYVDRGPRSREVLERLIAGPPPGFRAMALCGNHESLMLQFMADPFEGVNWLAVGGMATLRSYGIVFPARQPLRHRLREMHAALMEAVPAAHLAFLRRLPAYAVFGGYAFVHAGIRPGIALPDQRTDDLLWIRDDFLRSTESHGRMVVHGHTISQKPQLLPNRIGIDTGAFVTGRLTAVVLEGQARRFLQTTPPASDGIPTEGTPRIKTDLSKAD